MDQIQAYIQVNQPRDLKVTQVRSNYLATILCLVASLTLSACTMTATTEENADVTPALTTSGEVVGISEDFGNVDSNITQKTFKNLGIGQGDRFMVEANSQSFVAVYGKTYSDVAEGEWVGMMTDYGNLRIAINFGNASEALGIKVGDSIKVSSISQ